MATTAHDAALVIEWGTPVAGREARALEEFFGHVQWWTELKHKGAIGEFRVYGTSSGQLGSGAGFVILEGTAAQIGAIAMSDDLRRSVAKVSLVVAHLQVRMADMGDAMTRRLQIYAEAVKGIKG